MRAVFVCLFAFFVACGGKDKVNHLPDAPGIAIRIEPADLQVTIVDGVAVTRPFTATFVEPDGKERDITADAVFSLSDSMYGTFSGNTLSVTGQGAGPVRVQASLSGVTGDTGLTVFVKTTIVDADIIPQNLPELFDTAQNDPSLAPNLVYPLDGILVPPNLGQFDVHWTQQVANVFEVKMSNQYVDIKRYTNGESTQQYWIVFQPTQWYPIASSRQQLTLEVAGMNTQNSTRKGTAAPQHIDVTNEDARGGIYYWSTSPTQGTFRYDVATPSVPPAPYFAPGTEPSTCMGCHALSRDGSKVAITLDGAGGRGSVFNVADKSVLVEFTQAAKRWNFSAFTPDN